MHLLPPYRSIKWIWVRSSKEKDSAPEEMQDLALREAGQVCEWDTRTHTLSSQPDPVQDYTAKIEAVKVRGSVITDERW